MLEIINHLPDKTAEAQAIELIRTAHAEARAMMPELPEDLQIYFDNWFLTDETGAGGFAYAPTILTMSFDGEFADKELQAVGMNAVVKHELYHIAQGHTNTDPSAVYRHALDSAIYEGCASVFERKRAHGVLPLSDYSQINEQQLQEWADALATISIEDYCDGETKLWEKWAIYDKETQTRWRVYRVGSWIVDRALANSDIDILEFRHKSAAEIEAMATKS